MTIDLPDDLIQPIRDEVLRGCYSSEDALVAAVLRDHLRDQASVIPTIDGSDTAEPNPADASPRKPLWQRIADLQKSVPEEEWTKLPIDGAEQLDHYLYGSPKRPTQ